MPKPPPAIRVADGGRLITSASLENVGGAQWSRKLNMRRVSKDQEGRCEGWQRFLGNTQYVFDGTESVLQLAELVRPNGERVIVGASRTLIKRYNTTTNTWTSINGALTFSPNGKRWQTCTINGFLVLNNGVDLPVSYRVEDATVTPIYELRQVGYARIGRICEYNGFLMIADLSKIKADQLDWWMADYSIPVDATSAKSANWTVAYPADFKKTFQVTTGAGTITATLPTLTFSQRPFSFRITKVDAGAGTVVTSPAIVDEPVVLSAINDQAFIWWNGTRWVAKIFAGGVIPPNDPYGTPPASIVERYPWAVANSEFGEPTHWAPSFSVLMAASSATIPLPMYPNTWVAGVTRVAVINGGPAGATLGGQTGYENGVLVTAINSARDSTLGGYLATLEIPTQAGLTYPRVVTVTRWTDISTIVAEYRLVGDSSEIMGMQPLGETLVIYRTTSIWCGRYSGRTDKPFIWTPRFPSKKQSLNLPLWGDAIADSKGEAHIFPGVGGRFYEFDGVSWPEIFPVCDDAKEAFFNGVLNTDEVFVVANPMTKAFWFCSPQRTFAYDFEFQSCSEMDAVVGAGAFVWKPGGTDRWFIMAIGRFVYVYALVTNAATNIRSYLRDGVVPTAVLKSGLIDGKDPSGEKDLQSYVPIMSSASPDMAVSVQLFSAWNPSATPVALMAPPQVLPTPAGESFFTTSYRALYFMDELTLIDTRDLDWRISARIFELEYVGAGQGIPRRVTA